MIYASLSKWFAKMHLTMKNLGLWFMLETHTMLVNRKNYPTLHIRPSSIPSFDSTSLMRHRIKRFTCIFQDFFTSAHRTCKEWFRHDKWNFFDSSDEAHHTTRFHSRSATFPSDRSLRFRTKCSILSKIEKDTHHLKHVHCRTGWSSRLGGSVYCWATKLAAYLKSTCTPKRIPIWTLGSSKALCVL